MISEPTEQELLKPQKGVKIMTDAELKRLSQKLAGRRQEIIRSRTELEGQWDELAEREIEFEEGAQKATLTEIFEQLDEREIKEIEDIDLALEKIAGGTYGICEECGRTITRQRLESLPAVRLCLVCATREEAKTRIPAAVG